MPPTREPLELPYTEADLDPEQLAIMSLNRLLTISERSTDQEIMLKSATTCAVLCVRLVTARYCRLPLPTEGEEGPHWPLPFIYRQLPPDQRRELLNQAYDDLDERADFAAWKKQRDAECATAIAAMRANVPPAHAAGGTGVPPVKSNAIELSADPAVANFDAPQPHASPSATADTGVQLADAAGGTDVPPVQCASGTGVPPVKSCAIEVDRREAAGDFDALQPNASPSTSTDAGTSHLPPDPKYD